MSDNERIQQCEDMDTLEDTDLYFDELDLISSIEHELQVAKDKLEYEHIASFI